MARMLPNLNLPSPSDYSNISLRRVLELAAQEIGLTVNVKHCRQMKYNPKIKEAEEQGLIQRKRIRVYKYGRDKAGKKRTCFYITDKGRKVLSDARE